MMKACVLPSPAAVETYPLELTDVATLQPGKGELLVRVKMSGVCGGSRVHGPMNRTNRPRVDRRNEA
jgi:Zn-dependent alcohol dehydrogenase